MDRDAVGFSAMTRNRILALATLTLLVAAFLRIWQLAIYPPGPHYDEAAELLIARSIAFGGARFFPMVEAYQGREVLFYYLSVPLLAFVHDGVFSLRVLSVFCNLITIAASMALGRAMFSGRRGAVVGLAVGVLMTLSFPMIWTARQAFRSSALPMMQALALLFLWKGLRAKRAQHAAPLLVIAGILAGGVVYTYNASRLFPFWLLIGGAALLLFDRAHWRRRLGQGAIFFGALAVTAAPMAVYAFQRPDVFWGRLAEVTLPDQSVTLAQSILLHLKLFFIAGDPYFRYNIAGRPYFTFPEGALLLIGIAVAAFRLTRRTAPPKRVAYLLALLSPLMVIPSVISVGGLPPNFLRSLGMVPLIFVLVAVGAEWVLARAEQWLSARIFVGAQHAVPLPSILVMLSLFVGGYFTADLYSGWASSAALYYETDADLAAAARWLVDQHVEGEPVYLAARDKGHPTVMIEPVPPITWLGTDSLFRPPPGVTGLYIFPHSAPPPADWTAWLAPGAIVDLPLAPDGQPAFQAFRISGDAPLPVDPAAFPAQNQYVTLVGYDAPAIPAGSSGELITAWQIDAPPLFADFTPLVQVEDVRGSLIYRGDVYMAGTDEWRACETLIQRMTVVIPPATPPGEYRVRLAWVGRASDQYVPYIGVNGASGAVWAEIGTLSVTRPVSFPDPASLSMDVRQPTEIALGVTLLGWDKPASSVRPGETLTPTFYWRAAGSVRPQFALTAVLRGASGDTVLWSGQPVDDRYPADQWADGETLADRARWTIPREQFAGDYTLVLLIGDTSVEMGQVTVAGVARLFDPPPVATVMNVNFDDKVRLYGYSLVRSNRTLYLEIAWQSFNNIPTDYKVFVHLVGADGAILAQRDAMPKSDTYPTSLWLPDEYVTDTYAFPAVNAGYTFRVGLYSPDDGVRLPVLDVQHIKMGDFVEIFP